jgi:uncharacterized protein
MNSKQRLGLFTTVFVAVQALWTPASAQLNPNSAGQGLSLPNSAPASASAPAPAPAAASSPKTTAAASAATSAAGPASERKRELASQLVQAQRGPEMARLANELAQTAVNPALESHLQRISRLPKPQQDRALAQLDGLADKLGNEIATEVRNNLVKLDAEVLMPEYLQIFSEEELAQLVAFFNSEAVRKYQTASPKLGEKLVQKVVDASRARVDRLSKDFDAQAQRVNGTGAGAAPTPAPRPAASATR